MVGTYARLRLYTFSYTLPMTQIRSRTNNVAIKLRSMCKETIAFPRCVFGVISPNPTLVWTVVEKYTILEGLAWKCFSKSMTA